MNLNEARGWINWALDILAGLAGVVVLVLIAGTIARMAHLQWPATMLPSAGAMELAYIGVAMWGAWGKWRV